MKTKTWQTVRLVIWSVLSAGALAVLMLRGADISQSMSLLANADAALTGVAVALGALQVALLAERWRIWEAYSGATLGSMEARSWTARATVLGSLLGPLAGDLLRTLGVGDAGAPRWRGIVADRATNSVIALSLAVAVTSADPWVYALLAAVAIAGSWRFGKPLAAATALTFVVFGAIGVQIAVCAHALDLALPVDELLSRLPLLLCASLIPASLAGFTAREAALRFVYPSLSATAALSLGALLASTSLLGACIFALRRAPRRRGESSQSPIGAES